MSGDQPLRVLIVEDEVLVANELEYVIQSSGAEPVGHAMTAEEAIKLARETLPDLALVDVHLADGPTGIDAAREMTEHCGAVVLFITANLRRLPDDFAGACGVMTKPYSERQIRLALDFIRGCVIDGRCDGPPPLGLTLSPDYRRRWGVPAAA